MRARTVLRVAGCRPRSSLARRHNWRATGSGIKWLCTFRIFQTSGQGCGNMQRLLLVGKAKAALASHHSQLLLSACSGPVVWS